MVIRANTFFDQQNRLHNTEDLRVRYTYGSTYAPPSFPLKTKAHRMDS